MQSDPGQNVDKYFWQKKLLAWSKCCQIVLAVNLNQLFPSHSKDFAPLVFCHASMIHGFCGLSADSTIDLSVQQDKI